MNQVQPLNSTVAIVGAGPGGLVAARYLKDQGFDPVIFEQSDGIGGQWNPDASHSGVWPGMRTNTSRVMTAFSDMTYGAGTPVYPTQQDVRAYLERYAEKFGLLRSVRLRTRVGQIGHAPDGRWAISSRSADGAETTEFFARVIVASGRYHKPVIPAIPSLESFNGSGGVTHSFAYKDPDRFRGLRVLVCGGSISALEIASDLTMLGAARVVSTNRRQRYIVQKLLAGVPADHVAFTRFGALAGECMPMEDVGRSLKELITSTSGNPGQYGAAWPAENIFEAGVTISQNFLPLVAEGRIHCRPWLREVRGQTVRFGDGHEEDFDALIFGTGFHLDLPFLHPDIRHTLDLDACHLDLHKLTFHPDLPGLAFLGMFELVGPYFPVLELQARWIAYTWSGLRPSPAPEDMRAGIAAYRSRRGGRQSVFMHSTAIMFAREAGAEPVLNDWPQLARPLLFGPLPAISFRLSGPHKLPEAAQGVAEVAMAFRAAPAMELTHEQRLQAKALAGKSRDREFAHFVNEVVVQRAG